jgi:hypothetical protein
MVTKITIPEMWLNPFNFFLLRHVKTNIELSNSLLLLEDNQLEINQNYIGLLMQYKLNINVWRLLLYK